MRYSKQNAAAPKVVSAFERGEVVRWEGRDTFVRFAFILDDVARHEDHVLEMLYQSVACCLRTTPTGREAHPHGGGENIQGFWSC